MVLKNEPFLDQSAAFQKLVEAETKFFASQFLCPVLKGQSVTVRIAGVVMRFAVTPKTFEGWGVFQPKDHKHARKVREANMQERQQYLDLFPALRLILCRKEGDQWLGIPAQQNDPRFCIKGLVPVRLGEELVLFDMIRTRFDGTNCWFETVDPKHSARHALYLREQLNQLTEPDKLELPGLTVEERDAYLMAYGPAIAADIESKKDQQEERIKAALGVAGATYQSYIERGNTYTVEYLVNNERHRSVVSKETLAVESAGICLSGGDHQFDLTSLVSVIAEGQRRHHIVRVGDNRGGDIAASMSREAYENMYGRGHDEDDDS
jgi:hypothetical protein